MRYHVPGNSTEAQPLVETQVGFPAPAQHSPDWYGQHTAAEYKLLTGSPSQAQQYMQAQFAAQHREPVFSMFERCLFVAFAVAGIITCLATLYVYLELYLFVDRLQDALRQFGDRLTTGG